MQHSTKRTQWLSPVLIALGITNVGRAAEHSLTDTPQPAFSSSGSRTVGSLISGALWSHDNLIAWCVAPWDARKRSPEERAQMLAKLGFKHYAYIGQNEDFLALDAELDALTKYGVNLLAWYFSFEADDPLAKKTLEFFKRRQVRPQLWVTLAPKNSAWPKNQEEWARWVPEGPPMPKAGEDIDKLPEPERSKMHAAISRILARVRLQDVPQTAEQQLQRVTQEADRIYALHRLAEPYGVKIKLYNHNGWFGLISNQLAIIDNLRKRGVTDVGMVYNFSHARDELHDDSKDFAVVWKDIQSYVAAVNVTGLRWEREYVFPSQGDSELSMMRVIQDSGWNGPVGLIAEKGGDAEITLTNYLKGLDWLAAELREAGSGGPQPFPVLPPMESTAGEYR